MSIFDLADDMGQRHSQESGIFHLTTNARGRISWLTFPGVPEILIDNLCMTRHVCGAKIHAFNVLPDHMHIILSSGALGVSRFMHSFKRNSSKDVRYHLVGEQDQSAMNSAGNRTSATEYADTRTSATESLSNHIRLDSPNQAIRSRGSETPARATEDVRAVFTGWQAGFHDERIRDPRQLEAALNYVRENASRHHLVRELMDWPWSSLHFQDRIDPTDVWDWL